MKYLTKLKILIKMVSFCIILLGATCEKKVLPLPYQIGLDLLEATFPRIQCQNPKNKEQLLDMLKTGEAKINQIVHLKNGVIASFIDICDYQKSRFYLEGKNIVIVQENGISVKSKLETIEDCEAVIMNVLTDKYDIDESTKKEIHKTAVRKISELKKLKIKEKNQNNDQ